MNDQKGRLIVALDVETFEEARKMVDALSPIVEIFKVGSQLFTACGPVVVRYLMAKGMKVFLDLKFHDIPNTVAHAVSAAVGLGAEVHEVLGENQEAVQPAGGLFMCTLHTLGGGEMLRGAVEAATQRAKNLGVTKPLLLGITILTSEVKTDNMPTILLERARLAKASGLDGVVASSQEASLIRREFGRDFIIVTPGIRPKGAATQDQRRVSTPAEAITNGSDFLVVGRPIIEAGDPVRAARDILREMAESKKVGQY
ncbi:MAG TPA: orotidine-5'-phosphate decarboxylase [Candidatus Omnitrophica bacterium]|nr:MAG: orotidine 5'-phosphate decarboxylase [Omnitrophica WOR_2 bacterium GWA2_45_18]HBR13920.1 orotidine-5'-phosphate decarboxylase [Candidatus Omnitrophota bacterium]